MYYNNRDNNLSFIFFRLNLSESLKKHCDFDSRILKVLHFKSQLNQNKIGLKNLKKKNIVAVNNDVKKKDITA